MKFKEHIDAVLHFDDLRAVSNAIHFLLLYSSAINE
jgi:hypothetical protein